MAFLHFYVVDNIVLEHLLNFYNKVDLIRPGLVFALWFLVATFNLFHHVFHYLKWEISLYSHLISYSFKYLHCDWIDCGGNALAFFFPKLLNSERVCFVVVGKKINLPFSPHFSSTYSFQLRKWMLLTLLFLSFQVQYVLNYLLYMNIWTNYQLDIHMYFFLGTCVDISNC